MSLSACVLSDGSRQGMSSQGIMESKSKKLFDDQAYMCDAEIALACYQLAGSYRLGFDRSVNYERAQEFLVKACELEHFVACSDAAYNYLNGKGVEIDQLNAIRLFERGCYGGISHNCYQGGMLAIKTYQVSEDEFQIVDKLFAQSCKLGIVDGCTLAQIMSDFKVIADFRNDKNISKSMYDTEFEYECFSGNYESCHIQAEDYLKVKSAEPNLSLAYEFFARACIGGKLGKSCYFLGGFRNPHKNNEGKLKKSLGYLNLGCEFGDAQSCKTLSLAYGGFGKRVPIDADKILYYSGKYCKLTGIKCPG